MNFQNCLIEIPTAVILKVTRGAPNGMPVPAPYVDRIFV